MFEKMTVIVDTTKGPKMYDRYTFNPKPLLKFLLVIVLITAFILTTYLIAIASTPNIEVHCTNANTLVFQEIDSQDYIAYVQLANAEQVEAIKNLNVKVDSSVSDFRMCKTEVHHYEIRLDGDKCFMYADDVKVIPSEYNYEMSDKETRDALNASSEEVNYLYWELNKIFKIDN